MDFYFGIDLLQQLRQYYEGRLSLALAKGFDQQDAKYHWLFKELECRVKEAHVHDLGVAGVYVPADGGTDFCHGHWPHDNLVLQ